MTDVIRLLRDVAARNGAALRYAAAFDEFAEAEQLLRGKRLEQLAHDSALIAFRAWQNEMTDPAPTRPPSRYDPHDRGA